MVIYLVYFNSYMESNMSNVKSIKVRRSYKTTDESGNEVTKNRWPTVGRQVTGADGKVTMHLDFIPKIGTDGDPEPLFVFVENGESNEKDN